MMILNADDLGRSRPETDAALACHKQGRITSASAMVFMEDSERAADLAREQQLDAGLHLNLTQLYNGRLLSSASVASQKQIVRFMTSSRYAMLFYHLGLRQQFRDVFQAQWDEFVRLYGSAPSHIDGHHHKHLCTNLVLDNILPAGTKVRRNFSFAPGQKSLLNRTYRHWVDRRLACRHRLTGFLFSLQEALRDHRLPQICQLASEAEVEVETHPVEGEEYRWLMSDDFLSATRSLETRSYALL
jgi:predicted glycoside hydrolase/deacetylase ChbG (UPF0249 family)